MPTSLEDLLKNRAIRNYLSYFNERSWHKVVKYTMLIGIQNLNAVETDMSLITLKKLEDHLVSQKLQNETTDTLPDLQKRLGTVMASVRELKEELGIDSPVSVPATVPVSVSEAKTVDDAGERQKPKEKEKRKQPTRKSGHAKGQVGRLRLHTKPKHAWREGDDSKFRHPAPPLNRPAGPLGEGGPVVQDENYLELTAEQTLEWDSAVYAHGSTSGLVSGEVEVELNKVYPEWYGHDMHLPSKSKSKLKARPKRTTSSTDKNKSKKPPIAPHTHTAPIYEDDLVTTDYLNVASSGYGKSKSESESQPSSKPVEPVKTGPVVEEKKEKKTKKTKSGVNGGSASYRRFVERKKQEMEMKKKEEEREEMRKKKKKHTKPKAETGRKRSSSICDVVEEFLKEPLMASFVPTCTDSLTLNRSYTKGKRKGKPAAKPSSKKSVSLIPEREAMDDITAAASARSTGGGLAWEIPLESKMKVEKDEEEEREVEIKSGSDSDSDTDSVSTCTSSSSSEDEDEDEINCEDESEGEGESDTDLESHCSDSSWSEALDHALMGETLAIEGEPSPSTSSNSFSIGSDGGPRWTFEKHDSGKEKEHEEEGEEVSVEDNSEILEEYSLVH